MRPTVEEIMRTTENSDRYSDFVVSYAFVTWLVCLGHDEWTVRRVTSVIHSLWLFIELM